MHKLTFYPLGNADTCLIELEGGTKVLVDYAHCRDEADPNDRRVDLATKLRETLKAAKRSDLDVVAFTHGDNDHVCGASDIFHLEHAKKYQDGERIKIKELWVPAAMILEENLEGDALILRSEARYRLKQGAGIRVFSRPERLKEWLEGEGLTMESRANLITGAGQIVPGYSLDAQGIEFFVHSPFADRIEGDLIDRNECCLVLQATLQSGEDYRRVLLTADTTHDVWSDIVKTTRAHGNDIRLAWDILNIAHHCSYLSLNAEAGKEKTTPNDEVAWLLEQGTPGAILVSTSKPIPANDEDPQPPHRQAANCYREIAAKIGGEFHVTMEFPTVSKPSPMEITLDSAGATLRKVIAVGGPYITGRPAPRAG